MNKGFTLIELLAVIAILGILATIGGTSVFGIIGKSKQKIVEEGLNNIRDVSISYVEQKKIYMKICSDSFNPENPTFNSSDSKCYQTIYLKDLVNAGLFEVGELTCDVNKEIIVYRTSLDIRSYVKDDTCSM